MLPGINFNEKKKAQLHFYVNLFLNNCGNVYFFIFFDEVFEVDIGVQPFIIFPPKIATKKQQKSVETEN